jgi:hypothetical protein
MMELEIQLMRLFKLNNLLDILQHLIIHYHQLVMKRFYLQIMLLIKLLKGLTIDLQVNKKLHFVFL